MKIGIYAPWANGDMIMSTPFLKYKEQIWPGAQIVWFVLPEENHHATCLHRASPDIMAHNPYVSEIRPSTSNPSDVIRLRVGHRTNSEGHPLTVGLENSGRIVPGSRPAEFSDLDLLYFPAPQHNCDKLTTPFGLITRFVFAYPPGAEIHPCLYFSPEEDAKAETFLTSLPHKHSVMLETAYNSGQSYWDEDLTRQVMHALRSILGFVNFVFASPGTHKPFLDDAGVVDCSAFSIRQCIPVFNRCHLFMGTSSGISHAVSSWSANPNTRRIDCTNNPAISIRCTARGACSVALRREEVLPILVAEATALKARRT